MKNNNLRKIRYKALIIRVSLARPIDAHHCWLKIVRIYWPCHQNSGNTCVVPQYLQVMKNDNLQKIRYKAPISRVSLAGPIDSHHFSTKIWPSPDTQKSWHIRTLFIIHCIHFIHFMYFIHRDTKTLRHQDSVSWCLGVSVSWCLGVLVSQCLGVLVSWCLSVLVSQCLGVSYI